MPKYLRLLRAAVYARRFAGCLPNAPIPFSVCDMVSDLGREAPPSSRRLSNDMLVSLVIKYDVPFLRTMFFMYTRYQRESPTKSSTMRRKENKTEERNTLNPRSALSALEECIEGVYR